MAEAEEDRLEGLLEKAIASREPVNYPEEEYPQLSGSLLKLIASDSAAPFFAIAATCSAATGLHLTNTASMEKVAILAVTAAASYATARLLRQRIFLDRTETNGRPKTNVSRILSMLFNNPEVIAVPASFILANSFAGASSSLSISDSVALAIPYLTTTYTLATLAIGRAFHPVTLRNVKMAASALIEARKGRYAKAGKELSGLLSEPMGHRSAVNLQTAIGDMQMLSGNPEATSSYISALSARDNHYLGRSDAFIYPILSAITGVAAKAKWPAWAQESDVKTVIHATHAASRGKLDEANGILLSAVTENKLSRTAHMARASFLRATGQHRTANLEAMVSAGLVMRDPAAKTELVEGRNRNVVYFSGIIALKQNSALEPLEGERSVTELFRQRFGPSIIYPMDVGKRDGYYYMPSEKFVSETLLQLVQQRKASLEDFISAMVLMVQVQRFGLELYKSGKLPLNDSILRINPSDERTLYFTQRRLQAIENAERFNGVNLPQSYKDAMGRESAFIDVGLASSEILTMYKDCGPKNVLKRPFGLVQFLDFEPQSLRLLPPQMDLINLTESLPYLNPEQIAWLRRICHGLLEQANEMKLDPQKFEMRQAFSGVQWHYERLIYSPQETYRAKTPDEREEKKKDQVRNLLLARESFAELIEREYLAKSQLAAALNVKSELSRPIFPDPKEQERLEALVWQERKNTLVQGIPPLPSRIRYASSTSTGINRNATITLL